MRELQFQKSGPNFLHWIYQRQIQIIILTGLLMVDVVLTYLFIEVFHTGYEQNPFMAPVLELPFGYAILTMLKLLVVLLVAGMSWHAYKGLHSNKRSKNVKMQAHKLEVWLWWCIMLLAAAVDVILIINVSHF